MKRIIFLLVFALAGLTAFSQLRGTYVEGGSTFGIQLGGTEYHTFTPTTYTGPTINASVALQEGGTPISSLYASTSEGVTNGDSHDHSGGDGAQIDHTGLSNIGTNTHGQIDTHISDNTNPHGSTLIQSLIYSISGDIEDATTTTILTLTPSAENIYLLTFTGPHDPGASTFFGYGAYLVVGAYDQNASAYGIFTSPFITESYSDRVVVSVSGSNLRLQCDEATETYPLSWRMLRLK